MSIVAGVDFGTLSVRVSIVDHERGRLGSGVGGVSAAPDARAIPITPRRATRDHMDALALATRRALEAAGVNGQDVEAIALDTTGLERRPGRRGPRAARRLLPLVRPPRLARGRRRSPNGAHETGLEAIDWCGDVYSSRVGLLEAAALAAAQPGQARAVRHRARALRHGGGRRCAASPTRPQVPRSVCAMGHKWMWNAALGGLPPEEFLTAVDPLLAGVRDRMTRPLRDLGPHRRPPDAPSGRRRLGLRAGIPIPVGAFDAHWDAIGAGVRLGDVVNVIGTSTCIIAVSDQAALHPGPVRRRARLGPSRR